MRQSSKIPALHMTGFVYFPTCMTLDSSSGHMLAAGCKGFNGVGCDIKLWDLRYVKPGAFLNELRGHDADVTSCRYIGDDSALISCSRDGTMRKWDVADPSGSHKLHMFAPNRGGFTCMDVWQDCEGDFGSNWYFCSGDVDGGVSVSSMSSLSGGKTSSTP